MSNIFEIIQEQIRLGKKIIITGHGASGKDFLLKKLKPLGLVPAIFYTTRDIRQNEIHGVDYYFISDIAFSVMDKKGLFIDKQTFNNWNYGLTISNLDNSNIAIMNPFTIKNIYDKIKDNSFIIFLDIPLEIRKTRLSNRNDKDSVARRLQADSEMFYNFDLYDVRITESNF